jgi:tape measure domain-containing protein
MATIQTSIAMTDNISATLHNITNALNMTVTAFQGVQNTASNDINANSIDSMREHINAATIAAQEFDREIEKATQPRTMPPIEVEWYSPQNVEIFNMSGIQRYRQEVQSTNEMLTRLTASQQAISQQASTMNIISPSAVNDLNSMNSRIQALRNQITQVQNSRIQVVGIERANAEMQGLRDQLNNALRTQEDLNAALNNMDVTAANAAYVQLNSIVDSTERNIRDNVNEQQRFNQELRNGASGADNLKNKIMGMAAAYLSVRGAGKLLNLSDTMTQTTARLNLIVDDGGSVAELQNKIYQSAQNARASYQQTADVISKLGMQASAAFNSNDELIAFSEQLNKSFVIAGANSQAIESTMYNLTQALSSGVLRGQDFNTVMSNAMPIAQNIADYMGLTVGELREMAADGELSASIVKNAMLAAADETNARFEKIPKTFGDIAASMKNRAIRVFQPILTHLNRIANSQAFQTFANNAINALAGIVKVLTRIIEVGMEVYNFFASNWSAIAPIIYTIVGAFLAYELAVKACAIVTGIITAAKMAYVFVLSIFSATAAAATAAQWGLNAAMYANPIGIIIALVIALIVVFVMFTEQIVGAIWWLGALFKNIGLWIVNVAIGVWNSIKNIGLWFANLGQAIWAIFQNIGFAIANFFLGIWESVKAIASNIATAFGNAWVWIQIQFWSMVDGIMQGLKSVAELANKVLGWMGVNIDTSGLDFAKSKINDLNSQYGEMQDIGAAWAAGSSTFEYKNVGETFNTHEVDFGKGWSDGYNTFDVFESGWGSEAYGAGAEIGAGIHDSIMGVFDMFSFDNGEQSPEDYANGLAGIGNGVNDIANNTSKTANFSEEDLKYLRDIAERDSINKFTIAEINFEMGGVQNNVNSTMDLDGVIDYISDGMTERLEIVAEGVYA